MLHIRTLEEKVDLEASWGRQDVDFFSSGCGSRTEHLLFVDGLIW
jgi:hypothetical protein